MVKSCLGCLMRTVLYGMLMVCCNKVVVAQPDYAFSRFIVDAANIPNQNWEISHNQKTDMVYFANSEGLVEYNGLTYKTYLLPSRQSVRSVLVSSHGVIYTGSFEDFGYWKNNENCNLEYHSLNKNVSMPPNDEIWQIHEDGKRIVFQSFTSIYILSNDSLIRISAPYTMLFLFKIGNDLFAQVLSHGIYQFKNLQFNFVPGSEIFANKKIHAMFNFHNALIVGTENNGLYRYEDNNFRYWNSEISTFSENYLCNAGLVLDDSTLAFGTITNGVAFCNTNGEIIELLNFKNGLRNNTVLSLHHYKSHLWIGLDKGVNYINTNSSITNYNNLSGAIGTIYTVLLNQKQIYFGTNQGLFTANLIRTGKNLLVQNMSIVPGSQGQVWLLREEDNQILCGHNEGTFLVKDNKISILSDVTGGWCMARMGNRLFEGTYTGIVTYEKNLAGKWESNERVKNFKEPTRHIEVDYLGYIWASHHKKGIYRLQLNEKSDSVISSRYFGRLQGGTSNIDVFKLNNRIVFSDMVHLYSYDYVNDKMVLIPGIDESLGEFAGASQIAHYQDKMYWFIKGRKMGLFEVSIDFKLILKATVLLEESKTAERDIHPIQISANKVLIPARSGFMIVETDRLVHSDSSKLFMDHVIFSNRSLSKKICFKNIPYATVPYNLNNAQFYFADPSHFDGVDKRYLYRINEIDQQWHLTSDNSFSYANLPYGTFNLRIMPEVGGKEFQLTFIIQKPWYIANWAIVIYILILAILVYGLILFFKFEVDKQKQLLEAKISKGRLENELDYKNYELMLTMRYIIQKNEILSELNEQIESIKDEAHRYPKKFISKMEDIINHGLYNQTEEWKNAKKSLKYTEKGLFKKLLLYFPHLTPNDLRLASYLRMNFTTKEISKLLNISHRGVEISRYRLRKKLNLHRDDNLTEFLMSEKFAIDDL